MSYKTFKELHREVLKREHPDLKEEDIQYCLKEGKVFIGIIIFAFIFAFFTLYCFGSLIF